MIKFKCTLKKETRIEKWHATILDIQNYSSHKGIMIISRSNMSFRVIVGKTLTGNFACFPDFRLSCHLAELDDVFANTKFLKNILGAEDSVTVAHGIRKVAEFYKNSDDEDF